MEPIDTMNLAAMSLPTIKKEEEPEEEEVVKVEPTELRLMLFPSQIHKLTCLLALLAHLRDYVERLLCLDCSSPLSSLDWKSHLQYAFSKENKAVSVKVKYFKAHSFNLSLQTVLLCYNCILS